MKTPFVRLFAVAVAATALTARSAGTLEDTVSFGGALSYAGTGISGSELCLDLHGGCYVVDSVFVGGGARLLDNDYATTWELAAEGRFHFLDPWLTDRGGALADFSPYVALRLGFGSGETKPEDDKGAIAALRIGTDFFITENIAVDLFVDAATATGDIYPDKVEMKSSDVRVQLGIDLFF